jgi:DNA-directed RNA polymerase specialized sigma24 family protein
MPPRNDHMKSSDTYICKYWASRYASADTPFKDLMQIGYMAILECDKENHRWLAVRYAIQTHYLKCNRDKKARSSLIDSYEHPDHIASDPGLEQVDNTDLIEHLKHKARLRPQEEEAVTLIAMGGLTMRQAAKHMKMGIATVHQYYTLGLAKLRAAAGEVDYEH